MVRAKKKPKKRAPKPAKQKKPRRAKPVKRGAKKANVPEPVSLLERKAPGIAKLIKMGANAIIPADSAGEALLKAAKYVRKETTAGAVYYRQDIARRLK